ncbi:MAG: phosphoribosylglycinamide formyltransferase [Flavobacteriia bacterium]|nr:phosphoribosylglycinamide formyltransferase [Flavobacteriia bacterium]
MEKKIVKRIVLLASGSGTNAENIIRYFDQKENPMVRVVMVMTNNPSAGVLKRVAPYKVSTHVFDKISLNNGRLLDQMAQLKPDLIVLAGFLWKIPKDMVEAFHQKIINIHPALLPKYGGKGMYGERVHQAVKEAGEIETGITIHYVNPHYDEGAIIFQARIEIDREDSPQQIAQKVHQLEYLHYPSVIRKLLFF